MVSFPLFVCFAPDISQLAISEIGVSYPDASFGSESRMGVPFIFMLREVLQYDTTLDGAIERMKNKHRTCDLILGVGDGKASQVRGFQYSYSVLNVLSDTNFLPVNATWHAPIPDAIYWGMDWICPTFNKVIGAVLCNVFFCSFSFRCLAIRFASTMAASRRRLRCSKSQR